jgi:DNA-binding XRE family transcriptional regulator
MGEGRYEINNPAEFIKETRSTLELTQAEMAVAMGVSLQTINYWENGHRKPSNVAVEWCVAARTAVKEAKKKNFDWKKVLVGFGLGALIAGAFGGLIGTGILSLIEEARVEKKAKRRAKC